MELPAVEMNPVNARIAVMVHFFLAVQLIGLAGEVGKEVITCRASRVDSDVGDNSISGGGEGVGASPTPVHDLGRMLFWKDGGLPQLTIGEDSLSYS